MQMDNASGRWLAFDNHGAAIVPPIEHVIDRLLVEAGLRSASKFGTVAVVWSLPACDLCRGNLARYDMRVLSKSGAAHWANACVEHARAIGPKELGPGLSTYLMLAAEVPDEIRRDVSDRLGWDALADRHEVEPWTATYRLVGFGGPDARGVMGREIAGKSITVTRVGRHALELCIRAGSWGSRFMEDDDYRIPDMWSEAQVRHALHDRLDLGRGTNEPAAFALALEEAEQVTRVSLDSGQYRDSIREEIDAAPKDNYVFWHGDSWQRRAALLTAQDSRDPALVDRIAIEHPNPVIRGIATKNGALTAEGQMAVALQEGRTLGYFLLERVDVRQSVVVALSEQAVSGTFTGGADLGFIFRVAGHPLTPEKHLPALVERVRASDAEARVALARKARQLPEERRRMIHTELLRRTRRGKASARTVDAIVGLPDVRAQEVPLDREVVDHDEVTWLAAHPDRQIARVARARLDELGLLIDAREAREASLSAQDAPSRPLPLASAAKVTPHAVTDESVAVRLRHAWISELGPWLESIGHELGDCWRETTLVRRGLILDLVTPFDFGEGDPFANGTGQALERAVTQASSGKVNQIRWRHTAGTRAPRRGDSKGTDIFHTGDPTPTDMTATAAAISKRLKGVARADTREALNALVVAGESAHRVWFAVYSPEHKLAIGTVPGANGFLFEAIRKYQAQSKPLYTVVVDPFLVGAGRPLQVP